jgi:hypothetical protein
MSDTPYAPSLSTRTFLSSRAKPRTRRNNTLVPSVYTCTMAIDASAQALLNCDAASRSNVRSQPRGTQPKRNKKSLAVSFSPFSTSNDAEMKKKLHLVVALLCLLTLFISTASCMVTQLPHNQQASCGECPGHAPLSRDTPACCTTHQLPAAAASSVEVEQPAHTSQALTPLSLNPPAQSIALPAALLAETSPAPLLIALRI